MLKNFLRLISVYLSGCTFSFLDNINRAFLNQNIKQQYIVYIRICTSKIKPSFSLINKYNKKNLNSIITSLLLIHTSANKHNKNKHSKNNLTHTWFIIAGINFSEHTPRRAWTSKHMYINTNEKIAFDL